MFRKFLGCSLAVAAMLCLTGGCSDDVTRITSPSSPDETVQALNTGTDLSFGESGNNGGSQGLTFPDDDVSDSEGVQGDSQEPLVPSTDNGWSFKPIDNEKNPV
ncbi:MAG: hypothetical protein AB1772_09585 [Candidatus Zixiibacteriota bacterium]